MVEFLVPNLAKVEGLNDGVGNAAPAEVFWLPVSQPSCTDSAAWEDRHAVMRSASEVDYASNELLGFRFGSQAGRRGSTVGWRVLSPEQRSLVRRPATTPLLVHRGACPCARKQIRIGVWSMGFNECESS
jgi:hypothetical protein